MASAIKKIHVLPTFVTPHDWEYLDHRQTLPGDWGDWPAHAIAKYERETGNHVWEHWWIDDELYVAVEGASTHREV